MTILCAIWGLQQVVLKLAAPDIFPVMQIALRSGIAAVLVALLMFWQGTPLWSRATLPAGTLAGALFAIEFYLVGEGLRFTTAGHMIVFLYTAPIFVALTLHWKIPSERLTGLQWLGIGLAFAGIVITFAGRGAGQADASGMLWGDCLALLAGLAWGATTVVIRCSALAGAPATQTLFYQLLIGFAGLLLAAQGIGQAGFVLSPLVIGSLFYHGVIISFASFLTWFWLLRRYMASQLGVLAFMAPMLGVLFGVWLLDEALDRSFAGGAVLVLAGIVLVNGHAWLRQRFARP